MSETDKSVTEPVTATWALLLDIDFAAVNGIIGYRDAAADVLKGQGIDLLDGMFSRFLLADGVEGGVKALYAFLKRSDASPSTVQAKRVPICTPLAPSSNALNISSLFQIPPAAMTGISDFISSATKRTVSGNAASSDRAGS